MRRYTRRDFLRRGSCAGLAFGASKLLTGCGTECIPFIPQPTDTPIKSAAKVAAIRGLDLWEMTRQTLEALGGIDSVVHAGETVFIKANLGGLGFVRHDPIPTGDIVKPEIVATLAEECLKAGASKVVIGEGGQARTIPWAQAHTLDGTTDLVAEVRRMNATYAGQVSLVSLIPESPGWDPIPSPHTDLGEIYVSNLLTSADKVISAAVVKTHRWTQITGSMKNFIGSTSFDLYGNGMPWRYKLHGAAGGVDQCLLDIVAGLKPDLAIIDGSICCEGNGPHVMPGWWGDTIDVKDKLGSWFMLGSTDMAAADATAARAIGLDINNVDHLQRAYNQGIGQIQEDKIELVGSTLEDIRVDFKPADQTQGFSEVVIPGIALLVG